jgi:predicted metal-binding membrane protein
LAIAALSWLAMAWWHAPASPHGVAGHAGHLHGAAAWSVPPDILWIVGWVVMVLAMMLPTALPFLRTLSMLLAGRLRGGRLVGAGAAGFVLAWTMAGVALLAAGSVLSDALGGLEFVASHPSLPAGAAAFLAGAYQFTGLKRACLAACRSPAGMLLARWRADAPLWASFSSGLRYGLACIGCCWALMILGLLVGALALPVMVLTTVVMAAERMLPSVRPLIPLQAAFCVIVGVLLLAGVVLPATG